jgi:hypothetical protein
MARRFIRAPREDEPLRVVSDSIWDIMALTEWRAARGQKPLKVLTWPDSSTKIYGNIDARYAKSEKRKASGRFVKKPIWAYPAENALHVIFRRTFWGRRILEEQKGPHAAHFTRIYAKIDAFVRGKRHPDWSKKRTAKLLEYPRETRSTAARLKRFIEMLKTVDGAFLQRFLSSPSEYWNWKKFDYFVIDLIDMLINDEFRDGELTERALTIPTYYSIMNGYRKSLKQMKLRQGEVPSAPLGQLRWLEACASHAQAERDPQRRLYKETHLGTKRGSGQPPPVDTAKARIKQIRTLTTPASPMKNTRASLVRGCLDMVMDEIKPEVWTGLSTKAGFNITTSADRVYSRAEGGTAEAIRKMVYFGRYGEKVHVTDLFTGKVTGVMELDIKNPGTYIFHACLRKVLSTDLDEISEVMCNLVSEPGKGRSINIGHASLKIVLDVVHHIISWPLTKLESSAGGMAKSAQGWLFFNDLFKGDFRKVIFGHETKKLSDVQMAGAVSYDVTQDPAYCLSTDQETATDFLEFEICKILGNKWMRRCGVPPVLIGIVNKCCWQPRKVIFKAHGPMKNLGEIYDEDHRFVWSSRGALLGDPCTKAILHLVNACSRKLPLLLGNARVLGQYFSNVEEIMSMVPRPFGPQTSNK